MRQLLTTIITICAVSFLWNCEEKTKTLRSAGIEFDSIVIDTATILSDEPNAPMCVLKLNIKTAKGKFAEQINDSLLRCGILVPDYLSLSTMKLTPKEAVDSFIKKYFSDYYEFYTPIYRKEANKAYGRQQFEVLTDVYGGKEGFTIYTANISIISGEQNTEYTLVKNIEENSGKLLTLDDVFKDGFRKEVGNIILEHLAKQEGKTSDELLQEGFFASGDAYPSENFSIDEDGITFIYINGEIAHRLKGDFRVFVKYSKLNKWLKI